MISFDLTYKPYGEHGILIEWPSKIDEDILDDVLRFKKNIENHYTKEKVYIKSAYNSILVNYNYTIKNIYDIISVLKECYFSRNKLNNSICKLWRIPVCYDDNFGIDLEEISQISTLQKSEFIRLHSEPNYLVYFIGFLPGFLYLGGLHEKLHFPRRKTPRLAIEKGAVAIGGNQTGVYPNVSPGGWNIIGNSPIDFFNVNSDVPCFALPGDRVQFYEITPKEHANITKLVKAGVYQLESEVIHG